MQLFNQSLLDNTWVKQFRRTCPGKVPSRAHDVHFMSLRLHITGCILSSLVVYCMHPYFLDEVKKMKDGGFKVEEVCFNYMMHVSLLKKLYQLNIVILYFYW